MTTLAARAVPARLEPDASVRPIPWRQMAWVNWRQQRFAAVSAVVLLGVLALLIWLAGLKLHRAFAAAIACHPSGSVACGALTDTIIGTNGFLSNGFMLQAVPALVGAFVGAPLLARELETGTFRYAWTQAVGWRRWTLAKLVPLGVLVTAATGSLALLFSWYYQPYFATPTSAGSAAKSEILQMTPLAPGLFDLRGVTLAAWTLAAFAIGGLAGVLIRRVVPAIMATLGAYAALAFAAGGLLRENYLTPIVTSNLNVSSSAWVLSEWVDRGGRVAFVGLPPITVLQKYCPAGPSGGGGSKFETLTACLTRHGFTSWISYEPASRFWTFQWIEAGWLVALAILLIGASVWLVRWRAA